MKTPPLPTKPADAPSSASRPRRGVAPAAASAETEMLTPLDEHMLPAAPAGRSKASGTNAVADPVVLEPAPATARIKLETSKMSQAELLAQLQRTNIGMNGTPAYSALPSMPEVSAAAQGFAALLGNLAVDEVALKEKRQLAAQWAKTYANVLQQAALECEAADSSPATLLSGGWELRKGPGAAKQMPPPAGLRIIQSGYPGEGIASWKKVTNARYYELRIDPVPNTTNTITEPVVLSTAKTRLPLPPVTPGTQLMLCVRAIGGKGPGPYCERQELRVN